MPTPRRRYTPRQLGSACDAKLNISFRGGKHRAGWYVLDGKKLFRVTIPNAHSSWGPPVQKALFRNTRLSAEEFDDLVRCPMSGPQYAERARELFAEEP